MSQTDAPDLHYIAYDDFLSMVRELSARIGSGGWQPDFIIGVGRGGLVPAVYVSHELQVPMLSIDQSAQVPGFADDLLAKVAAMGALGKRMVFVDDINDSGRTIAYVRAVLASHRAPAETIRFAVLIDNLRSQARVDYSTEVIDRAQDKRWFVFPWEAVMTAETLTDEAKAVPERLG